MENLEPILPFFRPRSAEITWYIGLLAILLALGLATLIGLFIHSNWRKRRESNELFLDQAAIQGLSQPQAQFLLHLAHTNRLHNPLALLSSVYAFDRYLGELAAHLLDSNPEDTRLDTIAQIRTTLGFDRVPLDHPLRTTRQLPTGQTLLIGNEADQTEAHSPWVIVARTERSIAVAPLLHAERQSMAGPQLGDSLAVRFWRPGDSEYRYTTQVIGFDLQTKTATLKHAIHLERLQQRDFFRIQVRFPILLFAFPRPPEDEFSSRVAPLPQEHREQPETTRTNQEEAALPTLIELKKATPIDGQVLDLSAGGLCLETAEVISPESLLLIDPAFAGPFALDGILCDIVQQVQIPHGFSLQLKFVDLAARRESEIVRQLYQYQIKKRHPQDPPVEEQR